MLLYFFVTLVTGPRRSLSLELSDTRVYEPPIRARLGTTRDRPYQRDLTRETLREGRQERELAEETSASSAQKM